VRPPDPADAALPPFEPPEAAPEPASTRIARGGFERSAALDPATGELVTRMRSGRDEQGRMALARFDAVGMDGGDAREVRTHIHAADPLRARVAIAQQTELRRGAWQVEIATELELSCTREHFQVRARVAAREGDAPVFERDFDEVIPRVGI
jgi:hypothetical protein